MSELYIEDIVILLLLVFLLFVQGIVAWHSSGLVAGVLTPVAAVVGAFIGFGIVFLITGGFSQ